MLSDLNDEVEDAKRLLSVRTPASDKSIPKDKQEKPPVKKETPKNDDFNEYDYSDDKELDDKDW